MKKFLTLFPILVLAFFTVKAQVYPMSYDTVKMSKKNAHTELELQNSTDTVPGFLFNTGAGITQFKRVLTKINDTTYLIGVDTLVVHAEGGGGGGSADSSVFATRYWSGQTFYPLTGNPSHFITTETDPVTSTKTVNLTTPSGAGVVIVGASSQLIINNPSWQIKADTAVVATHSWVNSQGFIVTETDPVASADVITENQGSGILITGTPGQALGSTPAWLFKADTSLLGTHYYINHLGFLTTETDPIATAKTITVNHGFGISVTGTAGQTLGSSPSWSLSADTSVIAYKAFLTANYLPLNWGANVNVTGNNDTLKLNNGVIDLTGASDIISPIYLFSSGDTAATKAYVRSLIFPDTATIPGFAISRTFPGGAVIKLAWDSTGGGSIPFHSMGFNDIRYYKTMLDSIRAGLVYDTIYVVHTPTSIWGFYTSVAGKTLYDKGWEQNGDAWIRTNTDSSNYVVLNATGVMAGTYNFSTVQVDSSGRIHNISSGSPPATNLSRAQFAFGDSLYSSTGTGTRLDTATGSVAGLFSPYEYASLSGKMTNFGGSPGVLSGTAALIPAASSEAAGTIYQCTDNGNMFQDSAGVSWKFIHEGPNNPIGTIYQKNFWTSLADFPNNTTTAAIVTNQIHVVGGSGTYATVLPIGSTSDYREHWSVATMIQIDSSNATGMLGVGMYSTNTTFAVSPLMTFDYSNTTSSGTITLTTVQAGAVTTMVTAASKLSWSVGDKLIILTERVSDTIKVSVKDQTTASAWITAYYAYHLDGSVTPQVPNTGQFAIYSINGSTTAAFTIDSISVTSTEPQNPNYLFVGDSKLAGAKSSQWYNRLFDKFSSYYPNSINAAGNADKLIELLTRTTQIVNYHPKVVFMSMGRNDFAASESNATIFADYDTCVNRFKAAGIRVIHLLPFYESTVDVSPLVNHIIATYAAADIIDTYDPLRTTTGVLASDDVHPNDAGQDLLFRTTIKAGPSYLPYGLTSAGEVIHRYLSGFSGGTSGITGTTAVNQVAFGQSAGGVIQNSSSFVFNPSTVNLEIGTGTPGIAGPINAVNSVNGNFLIGNDNTNAGTSAYNGFYARNNSGVTGYLLTYGSNYSAASLANEAGIESTNGIVLFSDAATSSGGTGGVKIFTGGYSLITNPRLQIFGNGNIVTGGGPDNGLANLQVNGKESISTMDSVGSATGGYVFKDFATGLLKLAPAAGGSSYTFTKSLNNSSGTVSLVGDVSSGTSEYYGFNSSGTEGFFSLPSSPTGAGTVNQLAYWTSSSALGSSSVWTFQSGVLTLNTGAGTPTLTSQLNLLSSSNTLLLATAQTFSTGTGAGAGWGVANSAGDYGFFFQGGTGYSATTLQDKTDFLSSKALVFMSDVAVASGGTNGMYFYSGGSSASTPAIRISGPGQVSMGTSTAVTSALFNVSSTTQGTIPMPAMSSSNRTGISSPAEGLWVYDNTVHAPYWYNNSAWTTPLVNPMTTADDLIYGGASGAPTRLGIGSNNQILTVSPSTGAPIWSSVGTVVANSLTGSATGATTVTSYAVPGSGGTNTFEVGEFLNLQAVTTDQINYQITFTGGDDNASHTIGIADNSGILNLTATGYYLFPTITITVKQGTTITVATNLSVSSGSISYNAGAWIKELY